MRRHIKLILRKFRKNENIPSPYNLDILNPKDDGSGFFKTTKIMERYLKGIINNDTDKSAVMKALLRYHMETNAYEVDIKKDNEFVNKVVNKLKKTEDEVFFINKYLSSDRDGRLDIIADYFVLYGPVSMCSFLVFLVNVAMLNVGYVNSEIIENLTMQLENDVNDYYLLSKSNKAGVLWLFELISALVDEVFISLSGTKTNMANFKNVVRRLDILIEDVKNVK